ncbi:hypothetical protein IKQ19_17895 [Candidatus Saccharibacteria bacterium]|nr:hypothetical protein [Candidatus Saccharibacteria bacterium]
MALFLCIYEHIQRCLGGIASNNTNYSPSLILATRTSTIVLPEQATVIAGGDWKRRL